MAVSRLVIAVVDSAAVVMLPPVTAVIDADALSRRGGDGDGVVRRRAGADLEGQRAGVGAEDVRTVERGAGQRPVISGRSAGIRRRGWCGRRRCWWRWTTAPASSRMRCSMSETLDSALGRLRQRHGVVGVADGDVHALTRAPKRSAMARPAGIVLALLTRRPEDRRCTVGRGRLRARQIALGIQRGEIGVDA